jgi:hypothetical protein
MLTGVGVIREGGKICCKTQLAEASPHLDTLESDVGNHKPPQPSAARVEESFGQRLLLSNYAIETTGLGHESCKKQSSQQRL